MSLSPTKASETADVYAGSENDLGIGLNSSQGDKIEFMVSVKKRTMHVRVVSHGPKKVSFSVADALQTAQLTTPPVVTSTGATSPTGPVTGPVTGRAQRGRRPRRAERRRCARGWAGVGS